MAQAAADRVSSDDVAKAKFAIGFIGRSHQGRTMSMPIDRGDAFDLSQTVAERCCPGGATGPQSISAAIGGCRNAPSRSVPGRNQALCSQAN